MYISTYQRFLDMLALPRLIAVLFLFSTHASSRNAHTHTCYQEYPSDTNNALFSAFPHTGRISHAGGLSFTGGFSNWWAFSLVGSLNGRLACWWVLSLMGSFTVTRSLVGSTTGGFSLAGGLSHWRACSHWWTLSLEGSLTSGLTHW